MQPPYGLVWVKMDSDIDVVKGGENVFRSGYELEDGVPVPISTFSSGEKERVLSSVFAGRIECTSVFGKGYHQLIDPIFSNRSMCPSRGLL